MADKKLRFRLICPQCEGTGIYTDNCKYDEDGNLISQELIDPCEVCNGEGLVYRGEVDGGVELDKIQKDIDKIQKDIDKIKAKLDIE